MAVITRTTQCFVLINKKCIRFSNKQGKLLFLVLLLFGVFAATTTANPVETCNLVRNQLQKIIANANVLDKPTTGQICGQDSCCSNSLEQDLKRINRQQIDNFLKDSITKFASVIDFRARKFDALFKDMMNNSKREFHSMFHKTYGKIYLQNSDVFSDFFTELETYYRKGTVRLSETLEQFFGLLYQRMFSVINSQYSFDEKYLMCATEHMIELKPFGDVPNKLTLQLRRSFVATRTYYKSLVMAAETARKMLNIKLDEECEKELFKMQSCGVCKGLKGQGTCSTYCTNVLGTCLKSYTAFSEQWDHFIDALDKVADRLVGPYNIEMVVEPLNIKISEAVMNFQESGTDVSKRIFTLCGKPKANRRRRSALPVKDATATTPPDDTQYELKYEPIKLNSGGGGSGHHKKKNKKNKSTTDDEEGISELEKLIKEIKMKIRDTRQFWAHLPYQYCNNPSITAPPSVTSCYSGIGNSTTTSQPPPPLSVIVNEQIFNIQALTDKMRKAYQGEEVEIGDDSEDAIGVDGGGSGSGDGGGGSSGDFEIEREDDDDDDNDNDDRQNAVDSNDFNVDTKMDEKPRLLPPSTIRPHIDQGTGGAVATMPMSRALLQYLLPIVLVWFGGAITDLL